MRISLTSSLFYGTRLGALFAMVLIAANAQGQTLVSAPGSTTSLTEKWDWASAEATNDSQAWIVYQVTVQVDEKLSVAFSSNHQHFYEWNSGYNWGWSGNWNFNRQSWHNGISIDALLAGNASTQQDFTVARSILHLAKFENGAFTEFQLLDADTAVDWRTAPVYWLGEINQSESFRHLISQLNQHYSNAIDRTLLRAIGIHQDPDRESFLSDIVNDESQSILRSAALESLAQLESGNVEALLRRIAEDGNEERILRRIAISALSRYESDTALSLLLQLAGEFNPHFIRAEAIESLAHFQSDRATDLLVNIVEDDDAEELIEEALYGLSRRPEQYDVMVETAENNRNPDIRETAIELMVRMNATESFPVLENLIRNDSSSDVREEAIEELEVYPAETSVPLLFEIAESVTDFPVDIRSTAVETLGEFDPALVTERLNLLAWSDDNPRIRDEAVESLAQLDNIEANNLLLQIARNHPNEHTREEALEELQDNVF